MATFTLGADDQLSSRSINDLHPEMQTRQAVLFAAYAEKYPNNSQPFVTQTFRNPADQNTDFAKVPKVTNARASQSLHNYFPSLSFDVAFKNAFGAIDWTESLFDCLGSLAEPCDLNWGGSWHHFQDRPHFQPLNGGTLYSWENARDGVEPVWTSIVQQPIEG